MTVVMHTASPVDSPTWLDLDGLPALWTLDHSRLVIGGTLPHGELAAARSAPGPRAARGTRRAVQRLDGRWTVELQEPSPEARLRHTRFVATAQQAQLLQLLREIDGPVTDEVLAALWPDAAPSRSTRHARLDRLVREGAVVRGGFRPPPDVARSDAGGRPVVLYAHSDDELRLRPPYALPVGARARPSAAQVVVNLTALLDYGKLSHVLRSGGVKTHGWLSARAAAGFSRYANTSDYDTYGPYQSTVAGLPDPEERRCVRPDGIFQVSGPRLPSGQLVFLYDADTRTAEGLRTQLLAFEYLLACAINEHPLWTTPLADGRLPRFVDPHHDVPGAWTQPQYIRPVAVWMTSNRRQTTTVLNAIDATLKAHLRRGKTTAPIFLARACTAVIERDALDAGPPVMWTASPRPGDLPHPHATRIAPRR
jgi:hypothetical protein